MVKASAIRGHRLTHNPYPFDHFDESRLESDGGEVRIHRRPDRDGSSGFHERRNADLVQMLRDFADGAACRPGRPLPDAVHRYAGDH